MSLLKNIEEVAVNIQQQLVGGASGCNCGCSCSCHCGYSQNRNSQYTKDRSAAREGHFRAVRG